MGSVVTPPTGDKFTRELCSFLTSLASTSGNEFESIIPQLKKLREVLMDDVVNDTSTESESDGSEESEPGTGNPNSSGYKTLNEESVNDRDNSDVVIIPELSAPIKGNVCEVASDDEGIQVSNLSNNTEYRVVLNNNFRTMFSIQKGVRYELEDRPLKVALSEYGKVVRLKIFDAPVSGAWGFADFRTTHSATKATNQVIRVGKCWIHTCLPMSCLSVNPVPYQILLESRYLPQVWEKEMVLRSFFSKYGDVTGVSFIGYKPSRMQRFIISFKEASVAQALVGTAVKILTSTIIVKEVSSNTIIMKSSDNFGGVS